MAELMMGAPARGAGLEATEPRLKRPQRQRVLHLVSVPTLVVDYRFEAFDVFVGPNTIWDNPFVVGVHGDRARVAARYEMWILDQPALLAKLDELRGTRLGCEQPHRPSHAHVLARMADAAGGGVALFGFREEVAPLTRCWHTDQAAA